VETTGPAGCSRLGHLVLEASEFRRDPSTAICISRHDVGLL